ncbi:hypothetical protein [uncultured Mediterranean phage]|nr:hypothetical protein [uncultured Mediterranean phage]
MKQTAMIVINDPCIRCGKSIRADYEGFCMDCADTLNVSELNNRGEPTEEELKIINEYKEKTNVRTGRHNPRK